jgi:hypothetical protein
MEAQQSGLSVVQQFLCGASTKTLVIKKVGGFSENGHGCIGVSGTIEVFEDSRTLDEIHRVITVSKGQRTISPVVQKLIYTLALSV